MKSNISVLIVDDSKTSRMLLTRVLGSDPGITVLAAVENGQEAVDFVAQHKPDVVLMDLHMPKLDGFEATRRIMETEPVPIIICSSTANVRETATTFRVMEAGAVACVEKPVGPKNPEYQSQVAGLLETIKLMSEVKVIRRWAHLRTSAPSAVPPPEPHPFNTESFVVGIGASTGGPPVLQTILAALPKDFPPILIVQHIAHGFLPGLVEWLNQTTGWQVHVAAHGMQLRPGHAYLAPDDFQMGASNDGRVVLSRGQPENGLRPAVSHLFRSLAQKYGRNAIGVLLTGMGKDGAAELKLMQENGAVTIAQDRNSSVVHGMPGEAIALGGVTYILAAERIGDMLISVLLQRQSGRPTVL